MRVGFGGVIETASGHVDDPMHVALIHNVIGACLEKENICNEFYLQLIKQTTAPVLTDVGSAAADAPPSSPSSTAGGSLSSHASKIMLQSWSVKQLACANLHAL
jgi:hypothetical protein